MRLRAGNRGLLLEWREYRMSRAEAFLSGAVQIAGPLTRQQERIVSVKLHPDAVSVLQLHPVMGHWELERLVSWSLSAPIGRAPVQDNYPLLIDEISSAADEAGVDGVDAGISIPASFFDTRLLTLPFFTEADLAQEAEFPEFWEEFDPEFTNLDGKVVRYQILYANENEDRSVVLVSAISIVDVERFRGLLLDANLLPVYIENEMFSLLNGVFTRLEEEDVFKPFTVLHLCPGNNMVVGHARGRVVFKNVEISDFDEALLLELEGLDDVSGDFWEEVAIRLSEQVKQAIAFMVEERDFPRPDKVFLVSEYKNLENLVTLFTDRLDTTRVVPYDAMEDVDVPNEHARYVDFFDNPSVFTTAIGLATQGLNVEGKTESDRHRRLVSMNFLDDATTIRRNRQFMALNRVLSVAIIAVVLVSGGLLGFNTVPTYLQTRESSKRYDAARSLAQAQEGRRVSNEKKLAEIDAINAKIQDTALVTSYSTFLVDLPSLIPSGAELQDLTISEAGTAQISGIAISNSVITQMKSNFKREKFSRREPSVVTERDGDYWRFILTANLARTD